MLGNGDISVIERQRRAGPMQFAALVKIDCTMQRQYPELLQDPFDFLGEIVQSGPGVYVMPDRIEIRSYLVPVEHREEVAMIPFPFRYAKALGDFFEQYRHVNTR